MTLTLSNNWPVLKPDDRRLRVTNEEKRMAGNAIVSAFFLDMKSSPLPDSGLDAQLLCGDPVSILEENGEWAKVHAAFDLSNSVDSPGYVGWVLASGLTGEGVDPTHVVTAPRTFLYREADMKKPRTGYRSMGSRIEVVDAAETRGTRYAILASGEAIIERHIAPADFRADDFVAVAESLLRTPYLWGGNTAFGIDCSGLVQLTLRLAGKTVLRDTDMQAATLGNPVDLQGDWQKLQRGDLVFWRGHVAIAQGNINGEAHIIHANGYTMDVTSEPAEAAVERIAYLYEMPIGVRRL